MCCKTTVKHVVIYNFKPISILKRNICEYLRYNPIPSEMQHKCSVLDLSVSVPDHCLSFYFLLDATLAVKKDVTIIFLLN